MPSGYRSAGVDFDDLFDPYVTGTPPAATGYRIAGVGDLAGRYAPLIYGTQRADVGYRIAGGADVATLWAAKGTATYVSATAGLPSLIEARAGGTSGPLTAVATFSMARDGSTLWTPPSSSSAWYPLAPPGIGDLYDVEFTNLGGSGGTLTGSTLGVRHPLSSSRGLTLTVTRTISGSSIGSRDIRVDIRRIGSPTIVGTRTLNISAEADIS